MDKTELYSYLNRCNRLMCDNESVVWSYDYGGLCAECRLGLIDSLGALSIDEYLNTPKSMPTARALTYEQRKNIIDTIFTDKEVAA